MSGIPESSQWLGRTGLRVCSLRTFVTSLLLLASFVFLLPVVSTAPSPNDLKVFYTKMQEHEQQQQKLNYLYLAEFVV